MLPSKLNRTDILDVYLLSPIDAVTLVVELVVSMLDLAVGRVCRRFLGCQSHRG